MSDKSFMAGALPAPLRLWIEKAIAWAKGLSKPARVLVLGTALGAIAIAGYVGFRTSTPPYTVLFANLDRDDAAAVVAKLKESKVPYRVEGDGSVIEVPEANARELRLELAGAGLPRGGAVGFESFDKMRLGSTEFEQRILYRRALEGELARTIGTVASVQNARVHLVLPEKSVFVSKNEPSSASVVVKLRGGRTLGGGEVSGIVHLVSSSVAGLTPDRITVVTTEGTVLHKPKRDGDSAGDDEKASQARTLESTLEERARSMVEKMVGAGHVDVRVTADVDSSRVERIEDHYDPKNTALRSEERNVERSGDEPTAAGVPGAESNLPTGAARGANAADGGAPAATNTATGSSREQHTRNFEVDHISEKRIVTGGVLKRITVAVVVDGTPSRSKEDMDKIQSLVRNAVGFNEARGDAVTVEAIPFLAAPVEAAAPTPSLMSLEPKKVAIGGGALAAMVAVLATILIVRARRNAKKKKADEIALLAAAPVPLALGEGELEEEEIAPSADELRRLVREKALADPATAALIVRAWLAAEAEKEAA